MSFSAAQCGSYSIGPANQLFATLVQTILAVQCNITTTGQWPPDYGPHVLENGMYENLCDEFKHRDIYVYCGIQEWTNSILW